MASGPLRFADHFLEQHLSTNAQAETWRARAVEGAAVDVVLKRALPSTAERDVARALFQLEATLTLEAQHPHVARGFAAGEALGLPFFVREFVPGPSLAELRDRCVSRGAGLLGAEVRRIGADIAAGLAYLEDRWSPGAVLQDLHPGNVALDGQGRAKIIDLGGLWADGGPLAPVPRLFAPAYAAPEQRGAGALITSAVHVYALGCLLTELWTGRRARPGAEESPPQVSPGAPERALEALLRRLRCPDPARRPSGGRAAASLLASS